MALWVTVWMVTHFVVRVKRTSFVKKKKNDPIYKAKVRSRSVVGHLLISVQKCWYLWLDYVNVRKKHLWILKVSVITPQGLIAFWTLTAKITKVPQEQESSRLCLQIFDESVCLRLSVFACLSLSLLCISTAFLEVWSLFFSLSRGNTINN